MSAQRFSATLRVKNELYGVDTYCHISEILKEAKSFNKAYLIARGTTDHEQSWSAIRISDSAKLVVEGSGATSDHFLTTGK